MPTAATLMAAPEKRMSWTDGMTMGLRVKTPAALDPVFRRCCPCGPRPFLLYHHRQGPERLWVCLEETVREEELKFDDCLRVLPLWPKSLPPVPPPTRT
eukprot:s1636_g9.t1